MSNITGTICIEFDTNITITEKQFEEFKRKIELAVENAWESHLCEIAEMCGFQSENMHSILLDDMYCDYGEDKQQLAINNFKQLTNEVLNG